MNSKTRYNDKKVVKEIKENQRKSPETSVIYFIDTDEYTSNPDDKKMLKLIRDYCNSNHYDFVFFCKDIEDVYLGHRIPDQEKVSEVARFKRQNKIYDVKESSLNRTRYAVHTSNILSILDKHLTRRI